MTIQPVEKGLLFAAALTLTMTMYSVHLGGAKALGQEQNSPSHDIHAGHKARNDGHQVVGQWEGSPEGIAYSEFNHALTGIGVIMVGLSELRTGLGLSTLAWARFLLPVGMIASGAYLMVWSDHEAWPIGSLSLAETLSGDDPELLQHKIFAVLLLGNGFIELLIRLGHIRQRFWHLPLPGFGIVGGLLLFMHMHGPHPATHKIMMHHYIMGTLAITAGSVWFASEFTTNRRAQPVTGKNQSVLKIIWASLILVIGVQLLFYSES